MQRELLSAAVYISSGAASVATQAARAAARAAPRACVVDTFADPAYARSSVKIVGPKDDLLEATLAAARDTLGRVDLREEPAPAPHPRQGAVDMVSFMPLTERRDDDLLEACDALAWRFGEAFEGVPILMYGPRSGRSLVEARRGTSFFASTKDAGPPSLALAPDFGPADVTAAKGAAVVGAQPYVTNYNVSIDGDLRAGRAAAAAVRARFGVQVMALPHAEGLVEVGCNLQAGGDRDSPAVGDVRACIEASLPPSCSVRKAYVIGLAPGDALARAVDALSRDVSERSTFPRVHEACGGPP